MPCPGVDAIRRAWRIKRFCCSPAVGNTLGMTTPCSVDFTWQGNYIKTVLSMICTTRIL